MELLDSSIWIKYGPDPACIWSLHISEVPPLTYLTPLQACASHLQLGCTPCVSLHPTSSPPHASRNRWVLCYLDGKCSRSSWISTASSHTIFPAGIPGIEPGRLKKTRTPVDRSEIGMADLSIELERQTIDTSKFLLSVDDFVCSENGTPLLEQISKTAVTFDGWAWISLTISMTRPSGWVEESSGSGSRRNFFFDLSALSQEKSGTTAE